MINPLFIYASIWLGVVFLYSLGLTKNLVAPPAIGFLVILINIFSMVIIYLIVCRRSGKDSIFRDELYFYKIVKFLRILFFIWFIGTLAEVLFSGGVPLFWSFGGEDKLYTEFGVASLHGILNAIYLQLLTIAFYIFLRYKRYGYFLFVFIMMLWPILMLGRGILLSGIIQMACIYFYFNKLTLWRTTLLLFFSILVVVIFGAVGDMRQTANPFAYLVVDEYSDFFAALPSGFLWFYVYLTAGLSNFFANIEALSTNFNFGYSFSNMLPSVVKNMLGLDSRNDLLVFVDVNLNTSTVYAGFISDFGALGAIILVSIIQFFCCYAYSLLLRGRPWGVFAYAVCFQILMFTIFYDMFFLLPTLFQFVICFSLCLFLKARTGDSI